MTQQIFYPKAAVNIAFATKRSNAASDLIKLEAVEPLEMTIESNGINVADTFDVELDAELFPMDPAALSAVVLDCFVGDVGRYGAELARTEDTRLIIGSSDELSLDLGNQDRPRIQVSGRDYTGFFLDLPWGTQGVKLGRAFDVIIREIVARYESTSAMTVRSLVDGPMPVIPKGNGGNKKLEEYRAKASDKVWDVIQKLSRMVGLICLVRGDEVLIQPPLNISPLTTTSYPVFVDGLNLQDLKISRSFTTEQLPNVLVVARDPITGKRVEGTYPDPPNSKVKIRRTKSKVSKSVDIQYREYRSDHPAPTKAILSEVARRIYDGFRQQEMKLSFETRELRVLQQRIGGSIEDAQVGFSCSSIRNGTPIRIHIDRRIRALLTVAPTESVREQIARENGFKDRVAKELSRSWQTLDKLFYVNSATHKFSQSDGYSLSCEAVNFLEV